MNNLSVDSFVSRLKSTVSQVAYQVNSSVNTIIPGNAIHRDYETLKLRCQHGCPGLVWLVYDAVKRDSASIKASIKDAIGQPKLISLPQSNESPVPTSTAIDDKQLYSVFVFDKSQLDALPKPQREPTLDHIKKAVTQLMRLRHPAILTVHHPLEESRSSVAFVTEHVYGHLSSILKEQRALRVTSESNKKQSSNLVDLLPQEAGPQDGDYKNDSCQLDEVQIKAGLLHVCNGLIFLHEDAKLLHRNICLENIFVDSNNTWKIAGFDFSTVQGSIPQVQQKQEQLLDEISSNMAGLTVKSHSLLFPSLKTLHQQLHNSIIPNWSCSAPEHSNSDQVSFESDRYSLGIVTCALVAKDADMIDLSYEHGLISDTYKRGLYLREITDKLPVKEKGSLIKFVSMNPQTRPGLDEYQSLSLFTDPQVLAIRDLDAQITWDRLRKIEFFDRLRDVLPKLSHQIKVNRVVKSLFNEIFNPEMVPYALPSILIIAKDSTPTEFKLKIFPSLKSTFRILEPRSVPFMLLDNLHILATRAHFCLEDFQNVAFNLIKYLLKTDQQAQEKVLSILPRVKNYMNSKIMYDIVMPELSRLIKETTVSNIRINCLKCIDDILDVTDKSTVIRQVLPIVFELQTKNAEIVMGAFRILKTASLDNRLDLGKDILYGKILPFLIPLSMDNDLSLDQYNSIVSFIRKMLDTLEREQRAVLSKNQTNKPKSSPLILSDFE